MDASCQDLFVVFMFFLPKSDFLHEELSKEEVVGVFVFVLYRRFYFLGIYFDPISFAFVKFGISRLGVMGGYTTAQ